MSGYYYSREPGAEGQILTNEGEGPGMGLDLLLDREHPPLRAALEIGSAIADLLCIAVEDGVIHGDIRPAHIKIDARGVVSIEGYGVMRRQTRAPEGRPDSAAADIYGLGVVLHSMLSTEPLGTLPKDPDAHDELVVNRVVSMDFSTVKGKRWLEDVRSFLCQILAYAKEDRPQPLDAANVLASVAAQCPGEGLESWAHRASGQRAPAAARPAPAPPRAVEEDLGGPVAVQGPFGAQKPAVRQAPAAKGESTAFWSREKIAAMLADDDDDDAPPPPPRRQSVDVPKSAPSRAPAASPPRAAPPEPTRPPRVAEPLPDASTFRTPPRAPEPVASAPPVVQGPVASAGGASPFAGARIERSAVAGDPFEEPAPKKGGKMMWIGIGAVVLVLVCGGVAALGGGAWYATRGGDAGQAASEEAATKAKEEADKAQAEAKAAAEEADDAEGDEKAGDAQAGTAGAGADATKAPEAKAPQAPKAAATSSTKTSSGTSRTTSGASTSKSGTAAAKPAPAPAAAPAAPAAPAGGSYTVRFSVPGREGRVQCGDGQTASFAGATTMTFTGGTVTCLVAIDKGKGAVQVSRNGTVTCSEDAGKVTCSGG